MTWMQRDAGIAQAGKLASWLAFLIIFAYLGQDYLLGGNSYKQGDWLINIEQAFVRRGLLGSALIRLSDLLQVNLLLLVVLCQGLLLAVLAVCLMRVIQRVTDNPLFWLLVFSPAFILLFWANDPQGSMRKELFAYAAFALVLTGIADQRRPYFALATLLFAIGMLGHEANVLFLPAFLWLLHRARRSGLLAARDLITAGIVLAGVGLVSAAFFVRHVSISDAGPVCAPLLARGFDARFCEGAIGWVTRDLSYAIEVTGGNWSASSTAFWIIYALITALVCWFSSHFEQRRTLMLMYVATVLPFLPLFYVALDWGRWMNFHLSTWIFLVFAEQLQGRLALARPWDGKLLILMTVSVLPLAPSHMTYLVSPRAGIALAVLALTYTGIRYLLTHWRGERTEGASPIPPTDALQ